MYGSAGLGAAPALAPALARPRPWLRPRRPPPKPPWAAAISVIMLRRKTTFGPRPCAATPRYRRSSSALSDTCRAKKELRRSGPRGRETVDLPPVEQGLDLLLRQAHRRGRGDHLGAHGPVAGPPRAQTVDRRLVETGHGAERPGNEVQLVLDDQVGRPSGGPGRRRGRSAPSPRSTATPRTCPRSRS